MFDSDNPRPQGVEDSHVGYLHRSLQSSLRRGRVEEARDMSEVLIQLEPLSQRTWKAVAQVERARGRELAADAAEEMAKCMA